MKTSFFPTFSRRLFLGLASVEGQAGGAGQGVLAGVEGAGTRKPRCRNRCSFATRNQAPGFFAFEAAFEAFGEFV
ncbi:MAG: hypothetical protein LBI02_09435, partial [Opitutaceae bacterium]|nr:hypothetical protein [Opitutaceae bacterium]